MTGTNWDILKFKYEILGVSLEALSIDTGVPLPLIQRNAKEWNQLSLVEDDGNAALTAAERSSKLRSILKQNQLGPKYVELEMILLYKAIDIADNLSDSADNANIIALKNLTAILGNLIAQNPSLAPATKEDSVPTPDETTWNINVITAGGIQENKILSNPKIEVKKQ